MADVAVLFDEYAAAFARGEEPDLRAYLARAGEGAGELAALVDAFVARAEPPEPSEERVALAEAWVEGTSPLLALRARRGLKLDDLVAGLVAALGLDRRTAPKVKRYVDELESGSLSRAGVDRRVWDAWAAALRTTAETLRGWQPRPLPPAPASLAAYRVAPAAAPAPSMEAMAQKSAAPEPDEVDRLFLFGA